MDWMARLEGLFESLFSLVFDFRAIDGKSRNRVGQGENGDDVKWRLTIRPMKSKGWVNPMSAYL